MVLTLSAKAELVSASLSGDRPMYDRPDDRELPYGPSVAFVYELSGNSRRFEKVGFFSIQ